MTQHTPIPTVAVTSRVYTQDGKPVYGATVSMRLTAPERFGGYIVPREVRAETDAYGVAILRVWPNKLGSEASEYRVSIRCPEGAGGRNINGYAVVPDSDCDLSDIMELPAHEARSAGAVIPAEVAGYAAQASAARDAAQQLLDATQVTEGHVSQIAAQATASEAAAKASEEQAAAQAVAAGVAAQKAQDTAAAFEVEVVGRVETAATRLSVEATRMVNEAGDASVKRIKEVSHATVLESITAVAGAKADAVTALHATQALSMTAVRAQGEAERTQLAEEGELLREEFQGAVELSQDAARKAGCAAFKAAQSAQVATDTEQRIIEATKVFNACHDVYAYAQVSKEFSEVAGEHVEAAAQCRDAACESAQGAVASADAAQGFSGKAESEARKAARDATSARSQAQAAKKAATKAEDAAGRAEALAGDIELGAMYSTLEQVRLLSLTMREHIASLNSSVAEQGKMLLELKLAVGV